MTRLPTLNWLGQPSLNDWLVVQQMVVKNGDQIRRPDLIVFLNGLPIAVIELKDLANENADLWVAFDQVKPVWC